MGFNSAFKGLNPGLQGGSMATKTINYNHSVLTQKGRRNENYNGLLFTVRSSVMQYEVTQMCTRTFTLPQRLSHMHTPAHYATFQSFRCGVDALALLGSYTV